MSNWKSLAALCLALYLSLSACGSNRPPAAMNGKPDLARPFELPDFEGFVPPDMTITKESACGLASAGGVPAKKAVDLIIVIDNSGSMTNKIRGVELNINNNLAMLLDKSGIDYRTIFITSHGDYTKQAICVAPPLSGNNCLMPVKGKPVLTERYKHYDYNIQSFDSFEKVINTYRAPDVWGLAPNGWRGFLRQEAVKMFIVVTDDNPMMTGPQFDFMLRVLDSAQFGDIKKRNYIFHSIIGIKANNPVTKPWLPADGMQRMKCGVDAENWGEEYQALSILTGGLRFPICEWANFSGIFKEITKGVEEGTKLTCEILVPPPPDMTLKIDLDSLKVEYTPSVPNGAAPILFRKVASAAACAPDSFYLSADESRILLCPDSCGQVQKDTMAKLVVFYACYTSGARAPQDNPR